MGIFIVSFRKLTHTVGGLDKKILLTIRGMGTLFSLQTKKKKKNTVGSR
jgi:hypothetical protein